MALKKILIYSKNLEIGGIEIALINLLKNINYDKYKVDLYLEENIGVLKKQIPQQVNIKEYKVYKHRIYFIHKIQNFFNQLIFKIQNKNKYDCSILYATYSYAGNFVVRNASKNKIMYVHSDYSKLYNESAFRQFFTSRHIYDFTNIVFVSNESKKNFLKFYPSLSKKCEVINNFIDYETIENKSAEKIPIKIKRNDINLIFVGRLEENVKKVKIQIKLVKDLLQDIPNLKFYIIGSGIDSYAYKSYIEENNLSNNIFLLGEQENPYPYIKKCNYLLLTSMYEGFPLVFTEALVLKTQIISTLKISDDILDLGTNYGFVVSKQYSKMKSEVREILLNKKKKNLKCDFAKINQLKRDKLEELIDGGIKWQRK